MSAATKKKAEQNGQPNDEHAALIAAMASEEEIATRAAEIRGDAEELTPELFAKLRPLLRERIPAAFIETTPKTGGKPYESTGVKSVQVQIERMDAVLTPLWWWEEVEWLADDGSLAEVTIYVGSRGVTGPLFKRSSRGGVEQASTDGNRHKGTYTNAAKLAFARIGPGHEVYLGAADFDPDTDKAAAEVQAKAAPVDRISSDEVAELVSTYEAIKAKSEDKTKLGREIKVKLGAMGVPTPSVNRAFAALTPAQLPEVQEWLAERGES